MRISAALPRSGQTRRSTPGSSVAIVRRHTSGFSNRLTRASAMGRSPASARSAHLADDAGRRQDLDPRLRVDEVLPDPVVMPYHGDGIDVRPVGGGVTILGHEDLVVPAGGGSDRRGAAENPGAAGADQTGCPLV